MFFFLDCMMACVFHVMIYGFQNYVIAFFVNLLLIFNSIYLLNTNFNRSLLHI